MTQLLAWVSLVLVASTTAYGLQLTAAARLPSTDVANLVTAESPIRVLILAVDPVTGDQAQVECSVASDRHVILSDVILVDAKDFPGIAQFCRDTTATLTVLPDGTIRVTEGQQQTTPGTFGTIGNNPMLAAMQQRNRAVGGH